MIAIERTRASNDACINASDVAPPESSGITRLLRKVASGPPAEGLAGADLLQPALSETPPAAVPGLQRHAAPVGHLTSAELVFEGNRETLGRHQ
jgi:hypothetical protein